MNQMGLTDIYRAFHPNIKEYTFFSNPHGAFSKIGHIWGNQSNLYRYNKNWKNPMYLLHHQGLKLEINNSTNFIKLINSWKLNNAHLNHQRVKEEIKGKN